MVVSLKLVKFTLSASPDNLFISSPPILNPLSFNFSTALLTLAGVADLIIT